MKKYSYLLMAALFIFGLACEKEPPFMPAAVLVTEDHPILSVTPDTLRFTETDTVKYITVSNLGDSGTVLNWAASINAAWLKKVEPTSGVGPATIKVVVNKDSTKTAHKTPITFDSNGGNDVVWVVVTPQNTAPVADFIADKYSGIAPLAVQFTDKSTDSDGTISSWSWAFGDGATSTEKSPSHTYAVNGNYTVVLTVTDNGGLTDQAQKAITVSKANTAPNADFIADKYSGIAPLAVQFTDKSTDSDGTISSWSWAFGDGASSTEKSPSHTYAVNGNYTVVLTVTDNGGLTGSKEKTITVNAAPQGYMLFSGHRRAGTCSANPANQIAVFTPTAFTIKGTYLYLTVDGETGADAQWHARVNGVDGAVHTGPGTYQIAGPLPENHADVWICGNTGCADATYLEAKP